MLTRVWWSNGVAACLVMCAFSATVHAQVNMTGSWIPWTDQDNKIRRPGPDPDTFMGIPMNQAARDAALAYSPDIVGVLHRQCVPWPVHYIIMGPSPLEIWPTKRLDGSVLAWNIGGSIDRDPVTIWMDGRPHPSAQAAHTAGGFTTGHWDGDTLVTTTTHIQDGQLTRNGVPSSSQEVFKMFITRHEDSLTITSVIRDPVYLTAPYVLSSVFSTGPSVEVGNFPGMDSTCTPGEEEVNGSSDRVPSYLTPPADSLTYATKQYGIPQEAALGGEQTMYPEYINKVQPRYQRPGGYCTLDCCGSQRADGQVNMEFNIKILRCKQDNP
ncbi:MAG: hypothetical protein ACLPTF_14075 [Steroidobacteraceae bacterium]